MSLLPEFTDKLYDKMFGYGIETLTSIFNPDTNPITFEEVKLWFEKKVEQNTHPEFKYIGECEHEVYGKCYYHFRVWDPNYWANFYLAENGWKTSLNSKTIYPYDPEELFQMLPVDFKITTLELFGQMKGYFVM